MIRIGQKNPVSDTYDETNLVIVDLLNGASKDQNVDGSVTPQEFSYSPPAGYWFDCKRIMIYMEASTAFSSEKFGNLVALTNGWELLINGVVAANTKDNVELALIMFDSGGVPLLGKETQTMLARFTIAKLTDGYSGVHIKDGFSISTKVNDDLSTLTRLNVLVEGHLEPI